MAKEPNKSPDKDDAFDDGIEEIDIDDLLLDDDTPLEAEGAGGAPGKSGGDASTIPPEDSTILPGGPKPEIIDDGEIDLLAADIDEPVEEAPVEDLLALEDEVPSEPVRQTAIDPGAGSSESPTNGNPPGLDEEIALTPAKDEDVDFDLLAEDEAPTDLLDDIRAEEPAGAEPVAGNAAIEEEDFPFRETIAEEEAPGAPEDETAPLPAAEAGAEPTAAGWPVASKKKLGKLKAGKPLRPGKKGKKDSEEAAAEAAPAKQRARKDKKKAKEKPAKEPAPRPVAAGARGSITFVCSECYEEFLIPSSYSQEMVSCPECLHVGKRPDDEFLRTVHLHKAGEKRSFLSAVAVGAVLFVVATALVWFNTPYGAEGAGASLSMPLLGAAGLLTVILIWLVVRFEGNRWEVYF
jgi:hypothetical protein